MYDAKTCTPYQVLLEVKGIRFDHAAIRTRNLWCRKPTP